MRVLLVESDLAATHDIVTVLKSSGLTTDVSDSGEDAIEMARHYDYDIVVTAMQLPDMDAYEVLRRLRNTRNTAPVMVLSEHCRAEARIRAFAAGADDVMVRPLDQGEFIARLQAILRRSKGYAEPTLRIGNLQLNLDSRDVTVSGRTVHLTGKEYAILELLVLRKGMVLTKDAFLNHLYGGMDEPEMKIIDVFICKLRKKLALAGAGNLIGTVWGRGYMMRDEVAAAVMAPAADALSVMAAA